MSITDEGFHALKVRYKAAYAAYKSCVHALSELTTAGGRPPSAEMLAHEAKAIHELTEARRNLVAAIGRAAT